MTPSIRRKLEALAERHEELGRLLAEPDATGDTNRYAERSREYSQLTGVVDLLRQFERNALAIGDANLLGDNADAELAQMARDELEPLQDEQTRLTRELELALIPADPRDDANVFLEVRAGTGGDEAALFAGDLLRMYLRFAETQRWQAEIVSANPGEHGGYKEAVARIEGRGVFSKLKFESGTHRVQRVPATESQGRIHTSAATVAILPEQDEIDEIEIRDGDLRIDTFRASGAGGQHVNKTDSAIRITHLPSGLVIECQDQRSQHKNKAQALSLLKAKLLDAERAKQTSAQAESRRLQVGSGDRSQRIRTYNFPQGRLTDHRINLTLYKLLSVMEGDLGDVLDALQAAREAEQLADLESALPA